MHLAPPEEPKRPSRRPTRPSAPVAVAFAISLALVALQPASALATTAFNSSLLSRTGKIAWGVWGWSDGQRDLALVCERNALLVVDVTSPQDPVQLARVPALGSDLRVVRTYQDYAYTVSQCGPMQIIDLSDPSDIRTVATFQSATIPGAHTIEIDGHYAYLSLWGVGPGDFRILDLSDPLAPVEVGSWRHPNMPPLAPTGTLDGNLPCPGNAPVSPLGPLHDDGGQVSTMAHDCFVRGDTAYVAFGGSGWVALDISDRANPVPLAQVSYHDAAAHSMWATEDGAHLLTCDERVGGHLRIWDVRNLANVQQVGSFETAPGRIIHNVYVRGERAYLAYYTDGLRVLDISDRTRPIEVAFHDFHPGPLGGYFEGAFAAWPYGDPGLVYVSDMKKGLHLIQVADQVRGGWARGVVLEQGTAAPLDSARVRFLEIGKQLYTTPLGNYEIGLPEGWHTMVVEHYGHAPDTTQVLVSADFTLPRTVRLQALPWGRLRIQIAAMDTGRRLEGAVVRIAALPGLTRVADRNGRVDWGSVPAATYAATVGCFGYQKSEVQLQVSGGSAGSNPEWSVQLAPGFFDDASFDQGWTRESPGDDATEGRWVREDPNASWSMFPGPTAPDWDADVTPYGFAFHTGYQLPDQPQELFDVDGGRTTLTSPRFDLIGAANPVLYYSRWFSNDTGANPGEDPFRVEISADDGVNWTVLEEAWTSARVWTYRQYSVSDYVPLTDRMRLRFIARDDGGDSVVEAAVDRIGISATVVAVEGGGAAALQLAPPQPNPASGGRAVLRFRLPAAGRATLEVLDVRGRRLATLAEGVFAAGEHAVSLDEGGGAGLTWAAGLYWVRLRAGAGEVVRKLVVLPE